MLFRIEHRASWPGISASEDARERAYVPAIHVFFLGEKAVDARHKAGHGSSDPV
jgi:hypothetical protein